MENEVQGKLSLICGVSFLVLIFSIYNASARQNIVHGSISTRYDYQERTSNGDNSATGVEQGQGRDDRLGDERNYIFIPQLTFSSAGVDDLFQLSVAPSLNYDDLYNATDLDWDFRVQEEKRLSRNWRVTLEDNYFLGDDPVQEEVLRTQNVTTGAIRIQEVEVIGAPGEEDNTELTQRYGRTRFWTNTASLGTLYTYAEGNTVGVSYAYGVLRNDGNETIYAEYDRHDFSANTTVHINPSWNLDVQGRHSRGLFDDVQEGAGNVDDDLEEYWLQSRINFVKNQHLQFFGAYRYIATDFESSTQEDYDLHELLVGCDYDLSPQLSITVSGGPVIGSFENSSTDTDYVAYGGLSWALEHGEFVFGLEKGYEQNDFDGRGTGLTDFWSTNASFTYQVNEKIHAGLAAGYANYDRMQASDNVPVAGYTPEFGQTLYTEESYSAGGGISYLFAQFYQISIGYRYTENKSDLQEDLDGDYDEHHVFVELSWGKELFRW
jgi:hypothetical protein